MSLPIEISIILPVHNEEQNLNELYRQLTQVISPLTSAYEMIFVDDGSKDQSFAIIVELKKNDPVHVKALRFSRNFGHQLALTAGLKQCKGKAAIIMDTDLQDPPEVIKEFIGKWKEGYQVVQGVRTQREGETFFKKTTAKLFYKLIRMSTAIDIPENVGDFYLLDRQIIDILNAMNERHRFLRGLVAWVGYNRMVVPYKRKSRHSGTTKYSFWKMVKFSLDAMTSFSFAPLRLVSGIGLIISLIALASIAIIVYMKLFTSVTIVGWSSLMVVILFIGGLQLMAIGMIGEYIARIGDDVKARPLYNIVQVID